ncbi:MAG: BMP family ABC transporter substrate-binding protein [Rhodobacteraceae bacterium]|nr:BMP family ABC transporter substrate-binding protein [Paracoccaceae bacterium]
MRSTRRNMLAGTLASMGCLAVGNRPTLAADTQARVAGLFTVPATDRWANRIHASAVNWTASSNASYEFWEQIPPSDYEEVFRAVSARGYDLIIGDIFSTEKLARELAINFPQQAYLMGSSFLPPTGHPYFATYQENFIQDASYLTGMVAGGMTQTNILGLIGGYSTAATNRLMNAYLAGAREVNPNVDAFVDFLDEWSNVERARALAESQIENGADILYADRQGVAEAAREKGALSIGVLASSGASYADTEITAAVWHFEPTIHAALSLVSVGRFRTADYSAYSRLQYYGCSLAPLREFQSQLDEEALELVATREFELRTGISLVANNEEYPRES